MGEKSKKAGKDAGKKIEKSLFFCRDHLQAPQRPHPSQNRLEIRWFTTREPGFRGGDTARGDPGFAATSGERKPGTAGPVFALLKNHTGGRYLIHVYIVPGLSENPTMPR